MQNVNKAIYSLCLLLLLVSCSTKRTARYDAATASMVEIVSASPAVSSARSHLSGSVKLSAAFGDKSLSGRGTIRIKQDEGVQVGITALGLVEVACVEFLPDTLRFIYKIGKEYAEVPYSSVSFLQRTGIGYPVLESVLLNRLFSVDGKYGWQALDATMEFADEGTCISATTEEKNGVVYKFYIDKTTGNLVTTEGIYNGGAKVVCNYSQFESLNGHSFPHIIDLKLDGAGTAVSLQFKLSGLDGDDFEFKSRRVSSSYTLLNVEDIIRTLGGL